MKKTYNLILFCSAILTCTSFGHLRAAEREYSKLKDIEQAMRAMFAADVFDARKNNQITEDRKATLLDTIRNSSFLEAMIARDTLHLAAPEDDQSQG